MFRQFLEHVDDKQIYLITSLAIFFLFFVMVGIMLFMMKKDEVNYMSQLPINDED